MTDKITLFHSMENAQDKLGDRYKEIIESYKYLLTSMMQQRNITIIEACDMLCGFLKNEGPCIQNIQAASYEMLEVDNGGFAFDLVVPIGTICPSEELDKITDRLFQIAYPVKND